MEREELRMLVQKYVDEKQVRPSRINRPLTYQLYNELFQPKMRRDEKSCTCLDRDTDTKVSKHIEANYKELVEQPLPIQSNVKIDMSEMVKEKPKRKRSARTKSNKQPKDTQ